MTETPAHFRVAIPFSKGGNDPQGIYEVLGNTGVPSYCSGGLTINGEAHSLWDLESAEDAEYVRDFFHGQLLPVGELPEEISNASSTYRQSEKYLSDTRLIEQAAKEGRLF